MSEKTLIDALGMALKYEMKADSTVIVLGEDVGVNGGVFRATDGLCEEFGPYRVMDTPLAESLIAGVSIGMASQGLKPVAEIQFMGFVYSCLEQIICHAARLRNRTRGRLCCPMVLRVPFGGGIHAPEHHCESTEALFAHIPGLRVVVPSSPARAYGLLLSAIREPDPVIFLEPKRIYRAVKQEVEDDGVGLPLDTCFTLRPGRDITLISYGALVLETLSAATELAAEGIEAEVIDLASISPVDIQTIIKSVNRTGRALIIHEATKSFGVGAEISAQISERALHSLKAPVGRLNGYDTVMPYFQNEDYFLPDCKDIIQAVRSMMEAS